MKTVLIFNVALLISLAFARSTVKERISRLKCREYNELLKKDNICNAGYYPFVGAIGFENDDNEIQWTCSAALISDQYVLTVAHCAFKRVTGSTAKYVRLGAPDFTDASKAKIFNIAAIIRHPDYKPPSYYNDVAIFKLEKSVDFDEFIQPACIYSGEGLTEYYDVAGFSFRTRFHDQREGILVHQTNEVATMEECNKIFEPNRGRGLRLRDGVKFDIQFCSKEGDISCELTSAGVFLEKDKELSCMQNIAGLVETRNGLCSGMPGLNIKVSGYVDWIESVVWPYSTINILCSPGSKMQTIFVTL